MSILFVNLSEDDADTYRLVLSSAGISHHVRKRGHGWEIRVKDTDDEKAVIAIRRSSILQIPKDIHGDMGIYSIDRSPCCDYNQWQK